MDSAKQDKALIHFLTAELPEGFINYELHSHELQRRGAKQLTSVSYMQVKSKLADFILEQSSESYIKYIGVVNGEVKLQK